MGQLASELLVRAMDGPADLPAPDFIWITGDLGLPLVDLEDPEAVRRALSEPG
jgi:hypothetical protein